MKQTKKFQIWRWRDGEYPIDFVLVLILLLMVQEKTNRPDAFMFKKILDELLKEEMDIFTIVGTSTFRGR